MVGINKVKVRSISVSLAHVSYFFSEPEPWAYKQWTRFSVFELFEILQLPALLLSLAPASLFDTLLNAFSAFCPLFGSFLLYVQAGLAASVHVNMQGGVVLFVSKVFTWLPCLPRRFRNLRLGPPRPYSQNESRGPTSNGRTFPFLTFLKIYSCQLCFCLWPPRRSSTRF